MIELNTVIYYLVCVFAAVFIIGIEIFLACRKKWVYGLIPPILFVGVSIYELFTRFDKTNYLSLFDLFVAWIKTFMMYNIPTFTLLIIYLIVRLVIIRKKIKLLKEEEKIENPS